jgi:hypothetical protein
MQEVCLFQAIGLPILKPKGGIKMKTKMLALATVVVLLATGSAFAQLTTAVHANVPFPFTVGAKVLPAGEYKFAANPELTAVIVTSAKKGGPASDVVVLNYMSGEMNKSPDSSVVFDEIGGKYTLSELWIPGMDALVLNIVKSKHGHKTVRIPK